MFVSNKYRTGNANPANPLIHFRKHKFCVIFAQKCSRAQTATFRRKCWIWNNHLEHLAEKLHARLIAIRNAEIKKHAMFAANRVDVTIFREDSLGHKTLEIVSAQ